MKLKSLPLLLSLPVLMLLLADCGGGTAEPLPTYTPYQTYTPYTTYPATPAVEVSKASDKTGAMTTVADRIRLPHLNISPVSQGIPSYDRKDWRHWIDDDGDCQNTRHEVLVEESITPVTFSDARECNVLEGQWPAPFSGVNVFAATELDVDHMVPLANAHKSGGWAWDDERKREYANNLSYEGHLLAVTASANRSKGARGPEDWRPADENYWCLYAIDWITIKAAWGLTAIQQEWAALVEMLDNCVYEVTIAGEAVVDYQSPVVIPNIPTPTARNALLYDPLGLDRDCGDFSNWQQAQAFFEAAGGPTADRHRLDGDRDDVACESLPGAPSVSSIVQATPSFRSGPSARCKDGTYSYSQNRSGTCSHHGGVVQWY